MALQETLTADLKTAMLSRDTETVSVLRMVQSALKYVQIDAQHELTDEEIQQIIRKEVKKRTDSATTYRSVGHPDRAEAEEKEAELLRKYLPASVDPAKMMAFLKEEALKYQPLEARNRKDLIQAVMQAFPGQVDGKDASEAVNTLFN